jgi:hypothetical protein
MTTILNASTSAGLIITPDTSGNIQLQYNGQAAPAFSAYKSATQSLSGATWTKLTFDVEEFDTNNNFASSRFTPTVAGYYQINGAVNNGSNIQTVTAVYKNGSAYKFGVNFSNGYCSVVSVLVYCNGSTDYVELYGYFGSGASTGSGLEQTYFQSCLLRGA